jgi:uncharacterized protein
MTVNNITGSPVEGENFFGREKELDFAWNQIRKGNSMILSAPRRVGKSSFAKKLLECARDKGWNTLEINLEEVKSEEGFIRLFIEKLQDENWWEKAWSVTGDVAGQILERIKPVVEYGGAKVSLEWKAKKTDVYNKLKNLLNHKEETLIMMDEVTILLNNFIKNDSDYGKNDVEFFLNWLRSLRQVSGTKIRWIFCSSIGIDNFTSIHNLSYTLNDIEPLPIGEFSKSQAAEFVKALAISENLAFTEGQIQYMIDKLGWNLPYFIQILFSDINQLVKIHDKIISNNLIDEAYHKLISEKHLNTWDERLKVYNEFEPFARLLLKNLSQINEGESRENMYHLLYAKINDDVKTETILNKLLYMLRNDGYIVDNREAKYAFRSPLLRDFWFNRFAK